METNKIPESSDNQVRLPDKIDSYSKHYNESDFFSKIKKAASKAGAKVIYLALSLFYALENCSIKDKLMIFGALGYFILPADIIPDFIIGLGYTDDLAALAIVYHRLKANITKETEKKALDETLRTFPDVNPKELNL